MSTNKYIPSIEQSYIQFRIRMNEDSSDSINIKIPRKKQARLNYSEGLQYYLSEALDYYEEARLIVTPDNELLLNIATGVPSKDDSHYLIDFAENTISYFEPTQKIYIALWKNLSEVQTYHCS